MTNESWAVVVLRLIKLLFEGEAEDYGGHMWEADASADASASAEL